MTASKTSPLKSRMTTGRLLCVAATLGALTLGLGGCGGLYFGDNPGPDVRKDTGPLTAPPAAVRAGTAQ